MRDKNSPARHGGKRDEACSQLPCPGVSSAPKRPSPSPSSVAAGCKPSGGGSGVQTLVRSCAGNALGKFVSCFGQEGPWISVAVGTVGHLTRPGSGVQGIHPRLANAGCRTHGGLKKAFPRRTAFEAPGKWMGEFSPPYVVTDRSGCGTPTAYAGFDSPQGVITVSWSMGWEGILLLRRKLIE